ncbi:MAG: hypothetical protein ACPGD5_03370 [Salibacteraceae bacterium]
MKNYVDTDKYLHWLSQVIAKANRTFVPAKEDDSHTNLYFDAIDFRIVGRWIETPKGKIILSFNMINQSFEWQSDQKVLIQSVETIGKTITEIEDELQDGLKILGTENSNFSEKMHYEIPVYGFENDAIKELEPEDLKEWATNRRMANMVCKELLDYLHIDSEIRIWPHHFDTGFYSSINPNMSIGFGWAMQDEMAGAPYFYMSGYPATGEIYYSETKELVTGRWEIGENWKGAILPVSDFENIDFNETQMKIIGFLKSACNWFAKQ